MSILEFLRSKSTFIIVNFLLFILVTSIMIYINLGGAVIVFIFCVWFLPLISYIIIELIQYKKYYDNIEEILYNIDKKYLLPELLKETDFFQGELNNNILREISRDMHENIKYYRDMQNEYREYIEMWVHEIKTPIASTKLIIENNDNEVTDKIDFQVDRIDAFVEQVLYYSRSNDVSKDYIIKETNLEIIVRNVIKRNYRDFIDKKIKLDIKNLNEVIYSDTKWIEFIVNQIIGNSVKYCNNENPIISIYCTKKSNSVILIINDNGVGISDKDINRIFEKGFTGENGRLFGKSTGMGLYLCEKLCSKLGLKISISSKEKEGTKVSIVFPLLNMVNFTKRD